MSPRVHPTSNTYGLQFFHILGGVIYIFQSIIYPPEHILPK